MAQQTELRWHWKDHPFAIAATSFAGTLIFAVTIVFTAIIPTWLQKKDNEIARLNAQVQGLETEPAKLKLQLEAERRAKTAAEQRAADELALRQKIEESGRKKDEVGTTRAEKEFEKRIKDLEEQLGTERAAKEAAESRIASEIKFRRAVERPQKPEDAGLTSTREQPVTAQSFDLDSLTATADWARSNQNELQVSFSFTNKTSRPLWLVPATPRDRGGIQASDDVKNNYELISTGGFRRGSIPLRSPRGQNEYLELQPGVPAPATFNFARKRGGIDGATQVRFFATLTVVEDLQTLKSYNKTVTAILSLK